MSSNNEILRRKKQEQQEDLSRRYGSIGIKAVAAAARDKAREAGDAGGKEKPYAKEDDGG